MKLKGKIALVTGSSRGIGRAIALRLAEEGADICVNSNASPDSGNAVAAEVRNLGRKSIYYQANVGSFSQVKNMVTAAEKALGPITVLVNNAENLQADLFENNTEEYWNNIIDVRLKGTIYAVAAVLPAMRSNGYGKIINISGDSGRVAVRGVVVHAGVMGAIIAMTKSWALEFVPYGIRVNSISPGPIDTVLMEGLRRWAAETGGASPDPSPGIPRSFGLGKSEDVAHATAFLASAEADFITGQTLSVNGGSAFPS
jgi:NAD(P)-dependent dehydrogenase (short-subunit alcohol dehydrogenase family)